jgi:hypothetical protein
MTSTIISDYITVAPYERGTSFNVSFDDYRWLARTALGITDGLPAAMSIYKLPENQGCALDVWSTNCGLTIEIDSKLGMISLYCVALDSIEDPLCVLSLSSCEDSWRRLGAVARKELVEA